MWDDSDSAYLLTQGFKIVMAVGRQMSVLAGSNLSLRSKLEEVESRSKKEMDSLAMAAQEAKRKEQATLELLERERQRMREDYDCVRARVEDLLIDRSNLRAEMKVLKKENRALENSVQALNTRVDDLFDLGYFTACYEAVQGLPADLDLHSTLGWDRELIQARASKLQEAEQDPEGPDKISDAPAPIHPPCSDIAAEDQVRITEEALDPSLIPEVQDQVLGQDDEDGALLEENTVPMEPVMDKVDVPLPVCVNEEGGQSQEANEISPISEAEAKLAGAGTQEADEKVNTGEEKGDEEAQGADKE